MMINKIIMELIIDVSSYNSKFYNINQFRHSNLLCKTRNEAFLNQERMLFHLNYMIIPQSDHPSSNKVSLSKRMYLDLKRKHFLILTFISQY